MRSGRLGESNGHPTSYSITIRQVSVNEDSIFATDDKRIDQDKHL